jgi:hypothetical protein
MQCFEKQAVHSSDEQRLRPSRGALTAAAAAALVLLPGSVLGQDPLPLGTMGAGAVSMSAGATFGFEAPAPGFLTVVVRADGDVVLTVMDGEYQTLPDGRSDQDLGGDVGAEQFVVVLPEAGEYRVLVEPLGGGPFGFEIGATFLASELVAEPADPDGKPSGAVELTLGESHSTSLDPMAGDYRDWFSIRIEQAGVLTVLTRSEGEGDLKLEVFRGGDFRDPAGYSDQDMDGVLGNETVSVDVEAGETVHIRVSPSLGGGGRIDYRVGSGLIPG